MRFNQPVKAEQITTNYEGGKAFTTDPYTDLYIRTATQLVKTQKFYGDKDEQYNEWVSRIRALAVKDPEFVLKLASYTRNQLKLRTAPIIMLVETALVYKNSYSSLVSHAYDIIQRGDELAEIIAYFTATYGDVGNHKDKGSLPNSLKKIINLILASDKFNTYQLVKNDKNGATVSLRDVLRICHPKPESQETSEFYKRIVAKDSFPEVEMDIWEGIISKLGSSKASWEQAIKVMPIFATLRNIRNFYDNDVSAELIQTHVIDKLINPEVIKKSRILPFRFYQAYKEVQGRNLAVDSALEQALTHSSLYNIPEFPGKTAIFVDTSGSMTSTLNDKSKVQYIEIGALFGAILFKKLGKENALIYGYDNDVYSYSFGYNDSIFHIIKTILQQQGGATYAYKCIEQLINKQTRVDRIVMFSDMQSYNEGSSWNYRVGDTVQSLLNGYRLNLSPDTKYYDIDLSGYGTVQVNPHDRRNMLMAGWSEKIFDFMNILEDKRSIQEILANTSSSP